MLVNLLEFYMFFLRYQKKHLNIISIEIFFQYLEIINLLIHIPNKIYQILLLFLIIKNKICNSSIEFV